MKISECSIENNEKDGLYTHFTKQDLEEWVSTVMLYFGVVNISTAKFIIEQKNLWKMFLLT